MTRLSEEVLEFCAQKIGPPGESGFLLQELRAVRQNLLQTSNHHRPTYNNSDNLNINYFKGNRNPNYRNLVVGNYGYNNLNNTNSTDFNDPSGPHFNNESSDWRSRPESRDSFFHSRQQLDRLYINMLSHSFLSRLSASTLCSETVSYYFVKNCWLNNFGAVWL